MTPKAEDPKMGLWAGRVPLLIGGKEYGYRYAYPSTQIGMGG
jgi:hypothetical protein